jgi:DNA modification methylase
MHLEQRSITYQPIARLKTNPNNARTHSKHQIRQIAESIRVFGFTNPVLVDRRNRIIAGHGRVEAAKLLGMTEVPTIRLEDLSEEQVRAYVIADNRLAENSGWDKSILAIELQYLTSLDCFDFDVTITGFEVPEIDLILDSQPKEEQDDPDDNIPETTPETVTQAGDLWLLGRHRIVCDDVRSQSSLARLMESHHAALVFTDPPYNVVIDGNVSGKGTVKHGDFAMAVGEMSAEEFTQFLEDSLGMLARHSTSGAVHFVCMDWRHMGELLAAGARVYDTLLNLCVWAKDNGGQGSFYRSRHELVFVFRKGKWRYRNNIQLGRFGRYRTNVWEYPAVRGLSQRQSDEGNLLALHPTVKPVALIADAILDCSARGDLVLDGFLGSGSTLIAAERVGRVCYGVELDPKYVDVAIRRWQNYTGDAAVHAITGKQFNEIAAPTGVQHD